MHSYYHYSSPFDPNQNSHKNRKTQTRKHDIYTYIWYIPCHCSGGLHVLEMQQPSKPNQEKYEKYIIFQT